ncbi:MAG: molybdenum cofactor guanylyltransferase [Terriglobia bacterium]
MPGRFSNLTGFILAGGASRRMGRPKQHLILSGETQILRQRRLLESVCGEVAVVGGSLPERLALPQAPNRPKRPKKEEPLAFYEDLLPGHGPLGGIYTGLLRTRTEYNLFVGCDMPFLSAAFLRFIGQRALAMQADVTVSESADHRLQGLCGVYRRRARAPIRACLARDENKISAFYPRIRSEVIRWREIMHAGFRTNIFTNMNTPDDYLAVQKMLGEERFELGRASEVKLVQISFALWAQPAATPLAAS